MKMSLPIKIERLEKSLFELIEIEDERKENGKVEALKEALA